jgi:hypothetical protein
MNRIALTILTTALIGVPLGCGTRNKSSKAASSTTAPATSATAPASSTPTPTSTPTASSPPSGSGTSSTTVASQAGEPVIQRLSDPPTGLPGGALTFAYIVADPQSDRVRVQFEYKRVSDTLWRTALPDLSSPPFIGIVADAAGATYLFIWESGTDLRAFSGQVEFRVRAGDNTTGAYRYGPWVQTTPFTVTNP